MTLTVALAGAIVIAPPARADVPGGVPAVGRNADGRLEVFTVGTDSQLWHKWQLSTGGWSDWASLGGSFAGLQPAVGVNWDDRLEVFTISNGGSLLHIWQTPGSGSGWSSWQSLGGGFRTTDPVAVARNTDGRLEAFAVKAAADGSGLLQHVWQLTTGGWSTVASLGGNLDWLYGAPTVAANAADGRLEAFGVAPDHTMRHIWQLSPGGAWSSWASLGGYFSSRATAAVNGNGSLMVFATGSANKELFVAAQQSPGGGWGAFSSLGGFVLASFSPAAPAVGVNSDGRLEIFMQRSTGEMVHKWQTCRGCGWISTWEYMTTEGAGDLFVSQRTAVGLNRDSRLEIFALAKNAAVDASKVRHDWQVSAGSSWSGWALL